MRENQARKLQERRESQERFVWQNSIALQRLPALNQKYKNSFIFNIKSKYLIKRHPQSKQQFDTFRPEIHALDVLAKKGEFFADVLAKLRGNRAVFGEYQTRCNELLNASMVPADIPSHLFDSEHEYKDLEHALFSSAMLVPPVTCLLVVSWVYVSPRGRNIYSDERVFSDLDIERMLGEVKAREGRQTDAQRERAKVTPGLRYDVMKRDGFRCRLCGRGARDGVELEVDHIVPVSRGGKTTMDNLQTLCRDCNRGKGSKV